MKLARVDPTVVHISAIVDGKAIARVLDLTVCLASVLVGRVFRVKV